MIFNQKILSAAYWLLTAALFAVAIAMVAFYVPTEATMGPIQKIFYLHLPVAISTFLACLVCFIASIAYAMQRQMWLDRLAVASARVSVQLCSVVLLTGMIWGRCSWGQWWTWSPRLTFSLVLWLLYVVYLMVRMSIESPQRRAVVSAVYGIIAFLDVPLVYLSVRLMPDIHPVSVGLEPAMKLTLIAWFVPVLMLSAALIIAKYRLEGRLAELAPVDEEAPATPGKIKWAGDIV